MCTDAPRPDIARLSQGKCPGNPRGWGEHTSWRHLPRDVTRSERSARGAAVVQSLFAPRIGIGDFAALVLDEGCAALAEGLALQT